MVVAVRDAHQSPIRLRKLGSNNRIVAFQALAPQSAGAKEKPVQRQRRVDLIEKHEL
jgi:hypothetical protein